jgi:hypothetical protein
LFENIICWLATPVLSTRGKYQTGSAGNELMSDLYAKGEQGATLDASGSGCHSRRHVNEKSHRLRLCELHYSVSLVFTCDEI